MITDDVYEFILYIATCVCSIASCCAEAAAITMTSEGNILPTTQQDCLCNGLKLETVCSHSLGQNCVQTEMDRLAFTLHDYHEVAKPGDGPVVALLLFVFWKGG